MKFIQKLIAIFFIVPFLAGCFSDGQDKTTELLKKADSYEQAKKQAEQLVKLLSDEEKFNMVRGQGLGMKPLERVGIPKIYFNDASSGVHMNDDRFEKTTAFPCTQLLAATWDTEMAWQYAQAIGEECRGGGTHFLLGPGMNILRNPICGRNFEYLGEDPFLAAEIVSSYVKGMQSTGTAATLKHFVGNEAELHRRASNSIISDRALHEIYYPPFVEGIKAGALSVMTSYNLVNGEWAGQSKHLVNDVLREELGFNGLVMTDWTSTWDGVKLASSGVDFETPLGHALTMDSAKVFGTPQIDRMVETILTTCIYGGFYDTAYADPSLLNNWAERENIAYKTNTEGIVLLENKGILPIDPKNMDGKILVSGNNATRIELAGGGSGHVAGYNNLSYVEALKEKFGADKVSYIEQPTNKDIQSASAVFLFSGYPVKGENQEAEASDRPFVLPDDKLIENAVSLNPNTIVCLQTGGSVQMNWADKPAAVLQAFYGGQTGAKALADILVGEVCPSGKLPYTFGKKIEDSPAYGYEKALNRQIIDSRNHIPKAKAHEFFIKGDTSAYQTYDIKYDEGIFVGYRWFDKHGVEARFPFGHGLSYTSFGYSNLAVEKKENRFVVTFMLKNTGKFAGDEIAQLYINDNESSVERPQKELKGFKRVSLAPGESQKVEIVLSPDAFKFWDENTAEWKLEPGTFSIKVGSSSTNIKLNKDITI